MAFRQKGPLFFKSALKRTGVFEYDEDGNKTRIPYNEGVTKANQNKHIQFTNNDLITALETGVLDEYNSPNDQDQVKRIIANNKKKMADMPNDDLLFDNVRQEFVNNSGKSELEEVGPPPPNTNKKAMNDGSKSSYHIQQPDGTSKKGTDNWQPNNRVKSDAERKSEQKAKEYQGLSQKEKDALQKAANDKRKAFEATNGL